jgi:hypothetical protein
MTGSKLLRVGVVGCVVAAALLSAPAALASARNGWVSGTVSDPSGRPISAAEVRVNLVSGAPAVLTATTNGAGEFFLSGLAPGLYLLTARKDGYATASSRLNTLVQTSIALTLPPLLGDLRPEGEEPAPVPPDRAWALRLPRRDLLREEGAQAAAAGGGEDAEPQPRGNAAAGGEFQQLIALGGNDTAGGQAGRIDLGAELGGEVELTLSGESDDSTLEGNAAQGVADKDFERRQARLGARFDSDQHDSVEISALISDRRYNLQTDAAPGADAEGYAQQVRGYGARWERDLGSLGAVDVAVDYRSAQLTAGAPDSAARSGSPAPVFGSAGNEVWQAAASYQLGINDRRRMHIDMRARRLQMDDPAALIVSTFEDVGGFPGDARGEWALDLSGREQMALGGPLALDYGFNYHRRAEELFSPGSTAFIPEAGVTLSQADGTLWSAGISMALDRPEGPGGYDNAPVPTAQEAGLLSRFGYRLGMHRPFPRLALNVALNATYHPYAYGPPGEASTPLEIRTPLRRSLMVSEGNAQSMEVGLRLEKRLRRLVAALGSQWGHVEGYLVTGYFDEVPVQQVSYNLVRYMVSSARGYFPDSGTLVHADYQRYLNNPGQSLDAASLSYLYERVDLGVEQDLPFVTLWNARWRLLAAFQTLHTDSLSDAGVESLRRSGVRESESRLSGGLAIRF